VVAQRTFRPTAIRDKLTVSIGMMSNLVLRSLFLRRVPREVGGKVAVRVALKVVIEITDVITFLRCMRIQ